MTLSPQEKRNFVPYSARDTSLESRWKDDYATQRKHCNDLIDAENVRARSIAVW